MRASSTGAVFQRATSSTRAAALAVLLIAGFVLSSAAFSDDGAASSRVYQDSADPMADVQQALDTARASGKLLLVIMGAQWCHDSTGLAETFAEPDVAGILAENYETVFLDVGYFKDLRPISERFGQAHYFATPTVMIVDAATETLVNAADMHIWGSADSLPTERYVDYFSRYAASPVPREQELSEPQASRLAAFEAQNAERLSQAYAVLAPEMRIEAATGKRPEGFIARWREVRRYRMNLQRDIQTLREQVATEPDAALELPQYAPFSWE